MFPVGEVDVSWTAAAVGVTFAPEKHTEQLKVSLRSGRFGLSFAG